MERLATHPIESASSPQLYTSKQQVATIARDADRSTTEPTGLSTAKRAAAIMPRKLSSVPSHLMAASASRCQNRVLVAGAPYVPRGTTAAARFQAPWPFESTKGQDRNDDSGPAADDDPIRFGQHVLTAKPVDPDKLMGPLLYAARDSASFTAFQQMIRLLLEKRCSVPPVPLNVLRTITIAVADVWHWIQITPKRLQLPFRDLEYTRFYHCVIVLQNMANAEGLWMQVPEDLCPSYVVERSDGSSHCVQPDVNTKFKILDPVEHLTTYFPRDKDLKAMLEPVRLQITSHSAFARGKQHSVAAKRAAKRDTEPQLNARKLKQARNYFYGVLTDYVRIKYLEEPSNEP